MKEIEQMIFEKRFPDEDYDPNNFNDWAKENEGEAYKLCLEIARGLREMITPKDSPKRFTGVKTTNRHNRF